MPRPTAGTAEFATGHLIPGRPSLTLTEDGKIAIGRDGLTVDYAGDDACSYGDSATRRRSKFVGLVIHHTAPDHDTDWYVDYQIRGDRERGGHFGYHFYISPRGRIVQGAPLTKRTNHVSPKGEVRRSFGSTLQNTNAIGISCVGAGKASGFDPTDEQEQAVLDLCFALCDLFSLPFDAVVGHGEIQTNRMKSEGTALAKIVRSWQDGGLAEPQAIVRNEGAVAASAPIRDAAADVET